MHLHGLNTCINAESNILVLNGLSVGAKSAGFHNAAIDLVDEAAAKLKMEITSKPTALDEINRAVLKLEMERLSLTNDTDRASKDRLNRLEAELSLLKERQAELTEQWEHEKTVMTRLQSVKEEVCN